MKGIRTPLVFLVAVFSAAAPLLGLDSASSVKRQELLELASKLLAPRANPAAQLPVDLINPFDPNSRVDPNTGDGKTKHPSGLSDRGILEKVADEIKPSGMMVLNGRPLLIFREKKYEVGESIKRNLEGVDYVLVITAIDATSFRLRFNHEEITRPIKPAMTP
jgi:hypothetical protein